MKSVFSNGIETAHERRIAQIKQECENERIEFVEVQTLSLHEVNSPKSSLGSTMTSLVGGKAEYDCMQIYTLRANNQVQYFIQPFSGLTPLPGQHFLVIPVSIKNPIQYRIKAKKSFSEDIHESIMNTIPIVSNKKFRVCEWLCIDSEVKNSLDNLKLPVLSDISNVWLNGLAKIELDWTVQASAINNNYSLVCMRTGRYGNLGERSGLKQFREICSFVTGFAGKYKGDGANNILITNSFISSFFYNSILGQDNENLLWKPNNAVKNIITNLIKFKGYKKVYLYGDLDEKKKKNLQVGILTKLSINESEVVAAVAMDTLGNMKDAAVFTKDTLYISDSDYEIKVDLNDIYDCEGLKGVLDSSLDLILKNGETLSVKVGLASDFMKDFFTELCYIM